MHSTLRKLTAGVLIALTCIVPALADGAGFDWQLVREQGDIKIYKSPVEGSRIKAVKAVTHMRGNMDQLITLLRDPALRPKWDVNCGETYILEQVRAEEELVYLHVKLPWPIKDRDMVARNVWQVDLAAGRAVLISDILADDTPPKGNRVRVTAGFNEWQIEREADGILSVMTIAHLDPAGPLPSWIINMLSEEAPVDMLVKLEGLLTASMP